MSYAARMHSAYYIALPRPTAGHGVPASTSTVQQERAAGLEPATIALATQRSSKLRNRCQMTHCLDRLCKPATARMPPEPQF
jgi:hypothetical protein